MFPAGCLIPVCTFIDVSPWHQKFDTTWNLHISKFKVKLITYLHTLCLAMVEETMDMHLIVIRVN